MKVTHNTEGEGTLHPLSVVNEAGDSGSKSVDLILIILSTSAAEVLVSELGNPNWFAVEVVQLSGVGDESLSIIAVKVEGDGINLATSAGLEETSHPIETSLVIRASRRDEVVALTAQRVDVLLPELSSLFWGHVGLTGFVGLIHAKDIVGVTLDDQVLEVGNLIVTPEHWDSFKTITVLGQIRAPSVEEANLGKRCKVRKV